MENANGNKINRRNSRVGGMKPGLPACVEQKSTSQVKPNSVFKNYSPSNKYD